MNRNSCRIDLEHDFAASFFENAMHPNVEELQRRDAFFSRMQEEFPCWVEGTDIVAEIPDFDIAELICVPNKYPIVVDQAYEFTLSLPFEKSKHQGVNIMICGALDHSHSYTVHSIVPGDIVAA